MSQQTKKSKDSAPPLAVIRKIFRTKNEDYANQLLRCGCILLEVNDGHYHLGQIEPFSCPKCSTSLDFHRVEVNLSNDNCGWEIGKVHCPQCGKIKIPLGITVDEFFVDQKIKSGKEAD